MRHMRFYATTGDLGALLSRLDEDQPLKYMRTGKRWEINRPIFSRSSEIPSLGISTHETGSLSATYLVSPRDIKNVMNSSISDDGRRFWLINNGDNPDSVELTLGGLWTTGTLLPGHMSTLHETASAQRIMRCFFAAIEAERFRKNNGYWFGHEAIAMLEAGRRLVDAEQAPPSFDIPHPSQWPQSATEVQDVASVSPELIGGMFVDLTAVRDDGSVVRVMLVETLADGVTPTSEALERAAFIRFARPNDELRLVPKQQDGTAHSRNIASRVRQAIMWVLARVARQSER